jgi:hypothetical protein
MSRRSALVVVILSLTVAAAWATAAIAQSAQNAAAGDAPDLAALAAEVQALRERVRKLEERVAAYESRELVWLRDGAVAPRVVAPVERLPGRTPSGHINGVPYYIVPLEGAQANVTHAPLETAPAAPIRRR